jgi:hypothetical protein
MRLLTEAESKVKHKGNAIVKWVVIAIGVVGMPMLFGATVADRQLNGVSSSSVSYPYSDTVIVKEPTFQEQLDFQKRVEIMRRMNEMYGDR